MRIRVDFTIDIPSSHLAKLRELAATDSNDGAREFVQAEAVDYLVGYLTDNDVPATPVRRYR